MKAFQLDNIVNIKESKSYGLRSSEKDQEKFCITGGTS